MQSSSFTKQKIYLNFNLLNEFNIDDMNLENKVDS